MAKQEVYTFVYPIPYLESLRDDICELSRKRLNSQLDILAVMRNNLSVKEYLKQYNATWDRHAAIVKYAYIRYYRELKRQGKQPYRYWPD